MLLLGPPGSGKSLLGPKLRQALGPGATLLNVGQQLRDEGLVQRYQEHPTEVGRQGLAARARELIGQAYATLIHDSKPDEDR